MLYKYNHIKNSSYNIVSLYYKTCIIKSKSHAIRLTGSLDYRTTYTDDIDVSQYRIMLIIHNLKSY